VKLTIIEVYTIQSLDAVYAIYMYTYIVEHREHAACVEGNPEFMEGGHEITYTGGCNPQVY